MIAFVSIFTALKYAALWSLKAAIVNIYHLFLFMFLVSSLTFGP